MNILGQIMSMVLVLVRVGFDEIVDEIVFVVFFFFKQKTAYEI